MTCVGVDEVCSGMHMHMCTQSHTRACALHCLEHAQDSGDGWVAGPSGVSTSFPPGPQCVLANPCAPGLNCTDKQFGYICEDCPSGYTSKNSEGLDLDDAQKAKQVCSMTHLPLLLPCEQLATSLSISQKNSRSVLTLTNA